MDESKVKYLEESSTLKEYPDIFGLMFNNKEAQRYQKRKNYYKQKHRK